MPPRATASWVRLACLLTPAQIVSGANLCNLSVTELRTWLLDDGSLVPAHAEALFTAGVDGETLCHAPEEWIADQLGREPEAIKSGPIPSSLHACNAASRQLVAQGVAGWVTDPSGALVMLSSAHESDPQCCAPFREFSRFFLGPNSPFLRLRSEGRASARRAVDAIWKGEGPAQWRELAGYAVAHSLFYSGDSLDAGAATGGPADQAAAAGVYRELVRSTSAGREGSRRPRRQPHAKAVPGSERVVFVTAASEARAELGHLQASAARAGVALRVLGLGQRYEGHETKLRLYLEFLADAAALGPDDLVVLLDAYDVLLTPAAATIGDRFRAIEAGPGGRPILFAAERSLWPDAAAESLYPPKKRSSKQHELRFLNSGTVVGRAWALRLMLRTVTAMGALSLCGPDDQRSFHRFALEHPQLVGLDTEAHVFQTLHFLTTPVRIQPDSGQVVVLDEADGLAADGVSAEWRRLPCAVHGNGGDGKPAFARLVQGWLAATEGATEVSVEPPPFSRGIALYQSGDLRGAEQAFRSALVSATLLHTRGCADARNPTHLPSPLPLRMPLRVPRVCPACQVSDLEPAQRLDSAYNLGVVLTEQAVDLAGAAEAYRAALELDPSHEGALLNLALLHWRAFGEAGKATELADRCLRAHPNSDEARAFRDTLRSETGH